MSLPGFDSLRRNHPESKVTVDGLEDQISATLKQDPHAVIDHLILAQLLHAKRETVGRLLAELVKLSALKVRWFWICPNTHGTVLEADSQAEFPDAVECSMCGEQHPFAIDDTEVEFLPTDTLLRAIATTPQ